MGIVTKDIATEAIAANSKLYSWEGGAMLSQELTSGVLLHVCEGIFPENAASIVIDDCERQLAKFGRCICMVDSTKQKQMSTGFREKMTEYLAAQPNIMSHLLIASRLMQMAINVASLFIKAGRVRAYSNVAEWEAVGRLEAPGFRGAKMPAPRAAQASSSI